MKSGKNGLFWRAVLFLFLVGILILHANYYLPFLSDDSLISLRYASRLLDGKGLTWTDGRPVEGYSNLLWVLLVSFFGFFHVDLIDAARILGVLGMCAIILSVIRWKIGEQEFRTAWVPLSIGLVFFCLAAPIAVWAIGGLEQPLYGALLAVSIPLTHSVIEAGGKRKKELVFLSIILGLICITRPDGPIFTAGVAVSIGIIGLIHKQRWRLLDWLLLLVFPVLFYGGQMIFRLFYYGELVPNTALVKIAPSIHHWSEGLEYLIDGLWGLFPFSLFAIVSLFLLIYETTRRPRGILLLTHSVLWMSYVVFIGGDIFPAFRHFIPIIVVFVFALIDGIDLAATKFKEYLIPKFSVHLIGICLVSFFSFGYIQFTDHQNQNAMTERWEWDCKVIALLLKGAFSTQQPLVAVTAAGCIPYWSELPALDMLGLNDYYLPRHPPENIGNDLIGHELGSGKYILDREPDIIVFHTGAKNGDFRSAIQLQKSKRFYKLYTPIIVQGSDPHLYKATLWLLKYSDKIGIQRTPSEIWIPGYLFEGNETFPSHLNGSERLVGSVAAEQPLKVVVDSVSSQNWSVEVLSPHPEEIDIKLEQDDSSLSIALSTYSLDPVEVEGLILRSAK